MSDHTAVAVRRASVSDAGAVATLARRTFVETYADQFPSGTLDEYLDEAFGPAIQRTQIEDPAITVLVATLAGGAELAGYALLRSGETPASVQGPRAVELVRLYAEQRVIGQGVGAALMQASLDAARQCEFETVWLAVWDRNIDAQAFYARWGFEPAGSIAFPLGGLMLTDLLLERPAS